MPSPYALSSPPARSATRRRRHRRRRQHLLLSPFSAASRASPSPASSPASPLFSFSRSPSPFHHRFLLSPLHAAASAVPFAWEHRPGVPKTPERQLRSSSSAASTKTMPAPLPLPPSRLLLSGNRVGVADHPFTISDVVKDDDCFIVAMEGEKKERLGRRVRRQTALATATLTDCLSALSICRQSCTLSRDCLAGMPPQRPRAMAAKKAVPGWSG